MTHTEEISARKVYVFCVLAFLATFIGGVSVLHFGMDNPLKESAAVVAVVMIPNGLVGHLLARYWR